MAQLANTIVLSWLIVACSGCTSNSSLQPNKLPTYQGQSRAKVVGKLGKPQSDVKFAMSEAVGEFRIELQNTYPLTNPANAGIQIEEMTWKDGDFWITLWLHQVNGQWLVLDSCRWHKSVRF